VVVLLAGALALAIVAAIRRRIPALLLRYLVLCEAAIGVQAVLGISLAVIGRRPHEGLHFVYGPAVLLGLPVTLRIVRRQPTAQAPLTMLLGTALVLGAALRALSTGAT